MVFFNDKKYACETCIKGHRSSTCNHTDRPLFEIKKKGRPITQCEHCRELRKTKQVHVKCLCEGKDDHESISHSIPAKKANRKGPIPSAAFPHGLQQNPQLVEAPSAQHAPKDGSAQRCACKAGGECDCCTPRHPPRRKRSPTPPRPKMGELRAAATSASRSSSDLGDTLESSHPHQLTHGHGSRLYHGSSLYNPYGLAHEAHARTHNHQPYPSSSDDPANSSYPAAPLAADQREIASLSDQQRLQFAQAYEGTMSENMDGLLAVLSASGVDIDAWLQQTNGEPNMLSVDTSVQGVCSAPSSAVSSLPSSIPHTLDISGDVILRSNQEGTQQCGMYSSILPQFMGLDVNSDFNSMDQSFRAGDNDCSGNDGSGVNSSGTDVYDMNMIRYSSSAQPPPSDYSKLLPAPRPFLAFSGVNPSSTGAQFINVPFLEPEVQPRLESPDRPFSYLETISKTNLQQSGSTVGSIVPPQMIVPPLSRSSSTGSHSSSRSRSSFDAAGSNEIGMPHETWPRIRDSSDALLQGADDWAHYPPSIVDSRGDWVPASTRARAQVHVPGPDTSSMPWTSFISARRKDYESGPLQYS